MTLPSAKGVPRLPRMDTKSANLDIASSAAERAHPAIGPAPQWTESRANGGPEFPGNPTPTKEVTVTPNVGWGRVRGVRPACWEEEYHKACGWGDWTLDAWPSAGNQIWLHSPPPLRSLGGQV